MSWPTSNPPQQQPPSAAYHQSGSTSDMGSDEFSSDESYSRSAGTNHSPRPGQHASGYGSPSSPSSPPKASHSSASSSISSASSFSDHAAPPPAYQAGPSTGGGVNGGGDMAPPPAYDAGVAGAGGGKGNGSAPAKVPAAVTKHLSCPLVMATGGSMFGIDAVDVMVECHIATAVVTVRAAFVNVGKSAVDAAFLMPKDPEATVSAAQVQIGRDRVLETLVLPNEEANAIKEEQDRLVGQANGGGASGAGNPYSLGGSGSARAEGDSEDAVLQRLMTNPFVFVMPFTNVPAGETVVVTVTYLEDLDVEAGAFVLRVPLAVPEHLLLRGSVREAINIGVTINAGTPSSSWGSASHVMHVESESESHIVLSLDKNSGPVSNRDFEISYSVWNKDIVASLLVEDGDGAAYDPRPSFSLFVAPPAMDELAGTFRRNIVFVVDRSGSMGGSPMRSALEAVRSGLDSLTPYDMFNIIAFDSELAVHSQAMVAATPESCEAAKAWLNTVDARGLTDIESPLRFAEKMLSDVAGLAFVFLVTDGAVSNERQICSTRTKRSHIRYFTMGIGPYCNMYFLKQLAILGRGYSARVFAASEIEPQMKRLLAIASVPVLADVSLAVAGTDVEVYPEPVPDLYCGAPIVVSGKYTGELPRVLKLTGRTPSGEFRTLAVTATRSAYVPVSRIFASSDWCI
ncbi:von Willebrand factor type A domain-containing protein [Thecamonas trahens ATCC 50062]|uniref:von Willebrand factor type A domain-containing protein n=1 Tax=Thecamonas trahens ATCC 50062 TaxID=461836 RepID=A0A0L0DMP2_THETB|nr:von Willebrand factor type A domain-containing protein [Thecamonas trahens ATCC 50062]KNC53562.1 von Willebrand factor type A domain-containing protein [Thecamonas trahens ATCC 50062]|eukprot:XP_013761881.1 von Willebrand factor type A domain-containing protein [Thecamonas trahens ATCC 50062]